jgi:hypothetical protein
MQVGAVEDQFCLIAPALPTRSLSFIVLLEMDRSRRSQSQPAGSAAIFGTRAELYRWYVRQTMRWSK